MKTNVCYESVWTLETFFPDEQCPSCMNMELSSAYRQEAAVQGWRSDG